MRRKLRDRAGQMTVEFVIALPVLLAVAVVAVNVMSMLAECAAFDAAARDAIRVQVTSPGYDADVDTCVAAVERSLADRFDDDVESVELSSSGDALGHTTVTATLDFAPNLFGRGAIDGVFGVELPHFTHRTSLTVDRYKPGVLL